MASSHLNDHAQDHPSQSIPDAAYPNDSPFYRHGAQPASSSPSVNNAGVDVQHPPPVAAYSTPGLSSMQDPPPPYAPNDTASTPASTTSPYPPTSYSATWQPPPPVHQQPSYHSQPPQQHHFYPQASHPFQSSTSVQTTASNDDRQPLYPTSNPYDSNNHSNAGGGKLGPIAQERHVRRRRIKMAAILVGFIIGAIIAIALGILWHRLT
jgi:hypothetical protein